MTLNEFVAELQDRDSAIEQMAIKRRDNRTDWQTGTIGQYSQAVYELIDLFEDHTRNNQYASQLKSRFDSSLPPDIDKLNKLSAFIKSAITRLERKPELFIDAADQSKANQFFRPTVTLGELKTVPASARRTDPEDLYRTLMTRVSILETMLAERPKPLPGMGHNNPPDEGFPTSDEDVAEIERLIDLLKQQPAKSSGSSTEIAAQTSNVDKLSKRFFDKCVESAGSELGKKLVNLPFWYGLYSAARDVVQLVGGWLATQ